MIEVRAQVTFIVVHVFLQIFGFANMIVDVAMEVLCEIVSFLKEI